MGKLEELRRSHEEERRLKSSSSPPALRTKKHIIYCTLVFKISGGLGG